MEKLVFKMDEISGEGLEFDLAPDPVLYGIREVKVLNPPGISGWVKIRRDRSEVMIDGEVRGMAEFPCNRCLGPAVSPVGGEFFLRLVPQALTPTAEEAELHEEELDVEFFSGNEIDLGGIIAEQIYLTVPIRILCRADCRGLCTECGQDLNVKTCEHTGSETAQEHEN